MTSPTLELQQVSVYYGNQAAIEQASLTVQAGELMALVGPSGCGKSSLLASINRMTDSLPGCRVSGTIMLGGEVLSASQDATALRRRIGMVFQQPNPFPLSIIDNLRFPLAEHGVPRRERDPRAEQALRAVGLWEEVKDRLSQSALGLSGGQQQRLCIARALVLEPQVLLHGLSAGRPAPGGPRWRHCCAAGQHRLDPGGVSAGGGAGGAGLCALSE